eukprot:scaffold12149_cov214-Amphora_coffeaeformis.AAC.6
MAGRIEFSQDTADVLGRLVARCCLWVKWGSYNLSPNRQDGDAFGLMENINNRVQSSCTFLWLRQVKLR